MRLIAVQKHYLIFKSHIVPALDGHGAGSALNYETKEAVKGLTVKTVSLLISEIPNNCRIEKKIPCKCTWGMDVIIRFRINQFFSGEHLSTPIIESNFLKNVGKLR